MFIADSEDFWEDVDPDWVMCPCGGEEFEAAVAFSQAGEGSVRRVTVGLRCLEDARVGVYAGWEIGSWPTAHPSTHA